MTHIYLSELADYMRIVEEGYELDMDTYDDVLKMLYEEEDNA